MYHFCSAHAAASSGAHAMSTLFDGVDQAKYGLPYYAQDTKSTTNCLKYMLGHEVHFCIHALNHQHVQLVLFAVVA